ncbi:MAG: hypothetical protein ABSG25_09590 [Bryobacteraceae bacterium]
MPAPKTTEPPSGKPAAFHQGKLADARKPWKKKTPVEVIFEQAEKLREEIVQTEAGLIAKKRQLQKFEEARKLFESA